MILAKSMKIFFQILWKSRCHILVTFPSHLKKLRSIHTEILTQKVELWIFSNFSVDNNYLGAIISECIFEVKSTGKLQKNSNKNTMTCGVL